MIVIYMPIAWIVSWLFTENALFCSSQVAICNLVWISIIRGVQKRTDTLKAKNDHILLKSMLLELHFQHENNLDTINLSYVLIIYREFLLFQFFSRGICTHISIIRGVQNRRVTRGKEQLFSFKKCCLGSFFHWDESQLYANCLIYIPTVYLKYGLFQFFSRGICMNF